MVVSNKDMKDLKFSVQCISHLFIYYLEEQSHPHVHEFENVVQKCRKFRSAPPEKCQLKIYCFLHSGGFKSK